MTLLDRIKYVAAQKNIPISTIERDLGFSNKAIYRWNDSDPSINKVISVAKYLGVSIEWLATGEEQNNSFNNNETSKNIIEKYNELSDENKTKIDIFLEIATLTRSESISSGIKSTTTNLLQDNVVKYNPINTKVVPILGKVAAGIPISLVEEYLDKVAAPSDKADFATIANGNSMEPVIYNGENIFIKSMQSLDDGDIGVFDIDGETTCKKFKYDSTTKTVILTSFNSEFKPLIYSLKNYQDTFRIIGKVILTKDQEDRYHNFILK